MSKPSFIRSDQVRRIQSAPCGGGGGVMATTETCGVVRREGNRGEGEVVHSNTVFLKKCNGSVSLS